MIIVKDKLGKTISGESVNFIETLNKEGIIVPEYIIIHFTADRGVENSINWFQDPGKSLRSCYYRQRRKDYSNG
jgi:N-acetylmuramoyl-L-alanine amidase